MHILLGVTSILLVLLSGYLALWTLQNRRLRDWTARRNLQIVVLAAPLVSLAIGIGGLHHFAMRTCFLEAPTWDYAVGTALPLGMGLVALGAVVLGVIRLVLMDVLVARGGLPASTELRTVVEEMSRRVGLAAPRVRVCVSDQPVALVAGFRHPTVLLSTWIVERLDRREFEAVLAHELAHLARRDYVVVWLATILRDAFFYLPTSWAAYRQFQREKELACDELAVGVTRRPLALASALAKVWHQSAGGPNLALAQHLAGTGVPIEARIELLLADRVDAEHLPPPRAFVAGASAVALFVIVQVLNVAVILTPMDCGLTNPLGMLS